VADELNALVVRNFVIGENVQVGNAVARELGDARSCGRWHEYHCRFAHRFLAADAIRKSLV
jgi:hypothetical protein